MYLNIFNEPTETIEDIIIMSNIDQILTPNLINGIEAMSIVIPIRSGLIRPLRIGITILIASIPFIKFGVNIWSIFDIIMISSIVSVGSLNIFRYMDLGMYIYLLALIVIFPAIAGSIAVLIYGGKMWFIAPVLAVVLVGVIAATYYHMLVRIRRSYVDV